MIEPALVPNPCKLCFQAYEPLRMIPIVKEGSMYFHGESFMVIPARQVKTIIISIRANITLPCFDVNRLTIGIYTYTTLWKSHKPFNIIIHNSYCQPMMVGSRTIIVGVPMNYICALQTTNGESRCYNLASIHPVTQPTQDNYSH